MKSKNYKYSEITRRIIKCSLTVHNEIGNGFQEVIYQRALAIEMRHNNLGFAREFEMPVLYKDDQIGTRRSDFLVEEKILVEIKALIQLEPVHFAQAINYLEAYKLEIGLLINFGSRSLEFRRLINSKK